MKKIFLILPYFLIVILVIIISLLLINKSENKNDPQKNNNIVNNTMVRTFNGKPVNYINIENFLINKFCEASTGEYNSTWDYDKIQRTPKPNTTNNNNYICFVKDKQADKDLFSKQFDKQIGFTPTSICNKVFNQEFFNGHATDDQYACTFVAK